MMSFLSFRDIFSVRGTCKELRQTAKKVLLQRAMKHLPSGKGAINILVNLTFQGNIKITLRRSRTLAFQTLQGVAEFALNQGERSFGPQQRAIALADLQRDGRFVCDVRHRFLGNSIQRLSSEVEHVENFALASAEAKIEGLLKFVDKIFKRKQTYPRNRFNRSVEEGMRIRSAKEICKSLVCGTNSAICYSRVKSKDIATDEWEDDLFLLYVDVFQFSEDLELRFVYERGMNYTEDSVTWR